MTLKETIERLSKIMQEDKGKYRDYELIFSDGSGTYFSFFLESKHILCETKNFEYLTEEECEEEEVDFIPNTILLL